jgi:hypothetical protein
VICTSFKLSAGTAVGVATATGRAVVGAIHGSSVVPVNTPLMLISAPTG